MGKLIIKIISIIIVALLASIQFKRDDTYFYIGLIFVWLIAIIAIVVDIIDYKNQLKSALELDKLRIELGASLNIQESQLSELKALRYETYLLQDIGKEQLKATFYTEELNHKIGKVLLRIKLNHRMLFQDLCPIGFVFEINTRCNPKMKYRSFIDNGNTFDNGVMMESYKIYQVQDNGKCTGGHILGHLTTEVENIVIELDYPPDAGLLKDFHDEKLHIYLPENILNNSCFIELVANGWAILHRNIDRTDWSKLNKSHMATMWPEFKSDNLELYENWNEDRSIQRYAGWLIDLYSNLPTKHAAGISRWAGFN